MTFNSFSYFLFLPLVYLIFYVVPDRFRCVVLLVASYCFYATFKAPQLIVILILVTVISYFGGIQLARTSEENQRKRIFWAGTLGCVLILAFVKYLPPLLKFSQLSSYSNLLISIGVSYFVFQSIAYLADVYLGIQEPEQNLRYHALALAFFPKLLQGPIERASDLLPQLKKKYQFDYDVMRSGMLLFTWGLFKKVVLADRLALYVNTVYSDVHAYSGLPLFIATYAYAMQIYFDFSGYTDMARGAAQIFGINLTENFHSPYLARSIADFWRRWHISFSRWILDYIFKPLQLAWRDYRQAGTAFALILTFLVSGLWHGASWGFIVWGLFHGLFLATSVYYRNYQKKLHKYLKIEGNKFLQVWQTFFTFNLVCFTWIFFRAQSLNDSIYIVSNLFSNNIGLSKLLKARGNTELYICIAMLLFMILFKILRHNRYFENIYDKPLFFRWTLYYALIMTIILFNIDSDNSFVYFLF